MRPQPTTSTSGPQPVRQDDEWSVPPTVERRDDAGRQQVTQVSPPAAPPPTEERLFTNWSSEESPRERANQQLQTARSMDSRGPINQTEQTERESRGVEELRHVPESMMTVSSTQEQTNQVGARLSDHRTNTTVVGIRLSRDEDIIQRHNQGIQVPSSSSRLSSHSMYMEETIVRSNMPNIMPQLDGPTSV